MAEDMNEKTCWFCGTDWGGQFDPDDYYCHGCHEYVCEECDKSSGCLGFGHEVDDHGKDCWAEDERNEEGEE